MSGERKFSNPVPEYDWKPEAKERIAKFLAKVRAGNTLWIDSGRFGHSYSLEVVKQITKTLLRCESGKDFNLDDGIQRKRWSRGKVVAIATEQEIADHHAAENAEREKWQKVNDEKTAHENKCKELAALFGAENVFISGSQWKQGYVVSLDGLSEENVRELAARLQVALTR